MSFFVVAALLTAVVLVVNRDDGEAGDTSTTIPGDTTVPDSTDAGDTEPDGIDPAADSSCAPADFPDPNVRYRVTEIPDTFEEPTLNGRNVPSTSSFNGITSRPITAFPEFTELDLTYTDCEIAENGRVWWGVNYTGPDVAGGTFSGIVWSSTRFIEPVPSG